MPNILITGGAGFIGNHVVRLFVNKYPEAKIVCLDLLTYAGNLATSKMWRKLLIMFLRKRTFVDFPTVRATSWSVTTSPASSTWQQRVTWIVPSKIPSVLHAPT